MQYEVNECCGCAAPGYPCIGDSCGLRHAPRFRCDWCGVDDLTESEINDYEGEDLCDTCYDKVMEEEEENEMS